MNKAILLFFLIILTSCDNSSKKKLDTLNSQSKIESSTEANIEIRDFDKKLNLFLDFYQSMSPLEFIERANREVKNNRLFYRNLSNKEDNPDYFITRLIDSTNFSDSKKFNGIRRIPGNFTSSLYFPINTSKNLYYVEVIHEFDSRQLASITLLGPCFTNSPDTNAPYSKQDENNKKIRIEAGKEYKTKVLKLYSKKYGNPKVSKRKFNADSFVGSFAQKQEYDKNIYTYNAGEKTIEISVQCCAYFQTEIKYLLTSDYTSQKRKKQLDKNRKAQEQRKAKTKTLEEI